MGNAKSETVTFELKIDQLNRMSLKIEYSYSLTSKTLVFSYLTKNIDFFDAIYLFSAKNIKYFGKAYVF